MTAVARKRAAAKNTGTTSAAILPQMDWRSPCRRFARAIIR